MSPARPTPEQQRRWRLRDCARCGRNAPRVAHLPDGPICGPCLRKATQTRGICPGCDTDRLLPGRGQDQIPICRDCAGITLSFFCSRCRHEGRLFTGRLCARCTLHDRLTGYLDDGTGQIAVPLRPLAAELIGMSDPYKGMMWLRSTQVQHLLRDLATGVVPLTHEALHTLPTPWRVVTYLRDLLMSTGCLPVRDKQLLHYESWLARRLNELTDHPHEPLLRRFAIWDQLPHLRARAQTHRLAAATSRVAREQFNAATAFVTWMDEHDRPVSSCGQGDLEAWHAAHPPSQHKSLRAFLTWAITNHHLPHLKLPPQRKNPKGDPHPEQHRLHLINRAATDEQLPARLRVAAALILLYAQPVSRLIQLTIDDIHHHDDGDVTIRLGDPPVSLPPPFAGLLLDIIAHRQNMNTATNPTSRWLFPGQTAAQPLNPSTLLGQLRRHGFTPGITRSSTLRQLTLQAPAPVIAQALGFHHQTTTRLAAETGATWKLYAPGNHT